MRVRGFSYFIKIAIILLCSIVMRQGLEIQYCNA